MKKTLLLLVAGTLLTSLSAKEIKLPKPDTKGGKPLMQCFAQRKTSRNFSSAELPQHILSGIMYAADGINRPDGRKTVPTARNVQNQSIYAVMKSGVWIYQPKTHSLKLHMKGDHRAACGKQAFHKKAPLVLLYVSNMPAAGNTANLQALYSGNHAGYASQNVYLYAASQELSTVVCGLLDRKALKRLLKLKKGYEVIFSQPIGYPAK